MLKLRLPRLPQSVLLRRAALAYLIVWVLSPPLAYGTTWRVLAVIAMLLWLALDTLAPRSVLLRPNWPVLGTVVFVVYTTFIEWLVPDGATINRQFPIWIMLFFLLVGESHRRGRIEEARFCFWVVLLVLPVWCITSLRGINTYGKDAARAVTDFSEDSVRMMTEGLGGYGFVYTVTLCLPFLAHFVLRFRREPDVTQARWKRRAQQVLIWGNFVLAVVLILRAGYSIALILAAFAILSVLLIRSRRPLPLAMSVCFVGLLVLVAAVTAKPVLGILEGAATGTEYSAKVRDIRDSLEDEQSTGTVEGRTERYLRSIKLFVENPVIGTLTFDDVGKHSAILDRFAQYGFGFGLLFLALLIYAPMRSARSPGAPIGLALAFLIVAIGFPLLNNVFMSWGLILYVFSQGAFAVMGSSQEQGGRKRAEEDRIAHA